MESYGANQGSNLVSNYGAEVIITTNKCHCPYIPGFQENELIGNKFPYHIGQLKGFILQDIILL